MKQVKSFLQIVFAFLLMVAIIWMVSQSITQQPTPNSSEKAVKTSPLSKMIQRGEGLSINTKVLFTKSVNS